MLLRNATVWVGAHPTPRPGWVLVRDGRVAALGATDMPPPADVPTCDLAGRHVLPGFVDAHTHLSAAAFLPTAGDASGFADQATALAAVRAAAARTPVGEWVVFMRMDHDRWRDPRLPGAAALEAAGGGRPVLLAELSLHRGVASDTALRLAGVPAPADPPSDVARGRRGAPTGLVWERAFGRVLHTALRALATAMTEAGHLALLEREAERHLQLGIVRAHDPGVPSDVAARLRVLRPRTPLRLSWSAGAGDSLLGPPPPPDGEDGGEAPASTKLFSDGAHRCALCLPVGAVLGASAGAVTAALAGDVGPLRALAADPIRLVGGLVHVPWLRFADAELTAHLAAHAGAGRRLRIHALGNLAARQALRALHEAGPGAGATLEHLMAMRDEDMDALAAAGVAASVQPGFLPHYGPAILARRLANGLHASPVASLLARGIPVAISSDHPCGPLNPLHNARLAVSRRLSDGRLVDAREGVDRTAAIRAVTIGGAIAIGLPDPAGILPGEPADFAVCDGDPFAPATRVVETWIGGARVWPTAPPSGPPP